MAETSYQDQLAHARQLLGAEAERLTDDEVRQLLHEARAIARGIVLARIAGATRKGRVLKMSGRRRV